MHLTAPSPRSRSIGMGGRNASERVVTIVVARTELKQQLRNEKRRTELAQLDLQRMRPEDQRRRFEGSLLDFTKESWRWVEPSPFCSNWHIECMCEHFEAVSHRQILRLLINVPPRHSKSLGLNVFFPAWVWANNPDVDGAHPNNAIRKDCWLGPGVRFAYLRAMTPSCRPTTASSVGN